MSAKSGLGVLIFRSTLNLYSFDSMAIFSQFMGVGDLSTLAHISILKIFFPPYFLWGHVSSYLICPFIGNCYILWAQHNTALKNIQKLALKYFRGKLTLVRSKSTEWFAVTPLFVPEVHVLDVWSTSKWCGSWWELSVLNPSGKQLNH